MNLAVLIFVVGSAIQCGAVTIPMLFVGMYNRFSQHPAPKKISYSCSHHIGTPTGRAIVGLAIGQLTQVVPLFISEVRISYIPQEKTAQALNTELPLLLPF
jgi:hypothetical protein